jgi:hypothetical protein
MLGIPFGVWGLNVLNERKVKRAFERSETPVEQIDEA